MFGTSPARGQIRYLLDRLSSVRDRAGSSNSVALTIVFFTNLVDNLLLTSVVPVIPALLLQQDRQAFDHTNPARSSSNVTGTCSQETLNISFPHEDRPPPVFSLTSVAVAENSRVGWLLSSKAVVQILANFMIGRLCFRAGYPLILLAGSLIIFMSSMVFAFAESYIPLLLARSLQGLGSAGTVVAGMSIIARRYPDDKSRSRAMGIAMSGGACGVLVGYPFGGFMYNFVGKTAAFLIIAISILIDAGVQVFIYGIKVKIESYVTITPLYALLKDYYILIASGAVMLTTMSMSVLEPTVPLWVLSTMDVKSWQLGLVFLPDSIGYLVGTNCFGLPARNMGRWMCTISCMLLIALCLTCLPFATSLPQLILPHFGLGLGLGITDAAIMPLLALLVDLRHEAFYGCVYAVVQLAVCLAYFIGCVCQNRDSQYDQQQGCAQQSCRSRGQLFSDPIQRAKIRTGPSLAGLLVSTVGFPWLMRGMALINIIYCPLCYLLNKVPIEAEDGTLLSKTSPPTPKYTTDHSITEIDEARVFYGRLCEDDD